MSSSTVPSDDGLPARTTDGRDWQDGQDKRKKWLLAFFKVLLFCILCFIIVAMKYSKAIFKLREKLILSQKEFADLISVSRMSVVRWEGGYCEPTIKTKRKIKKLCDDNGIEA
jgi:DNA-binding XRE family transcriptional regulator